MNLTSRIYWILLCLLVISTGCDNSSSFVVEGKVSQAEGKMLYFERFGLNAVDILDSVKLDKEGSFRFKTPLPNAPEFFRIRLDKRYINLASDSARRVIVTESGKHFGNTYTVKGSLPCERIRDISIEQGKTLQKADSLLLAQKNGSLSDGAYQEALTSLFAANRKFSRKIILEDPISPAAYYALFQRYYDYLLFDPYDKEDNVCYAAVATVWELYYKEAPRTKHLVKLALPAVRAIRKESSKLNLKVVELDKATYFEISLPDIYDKNTRLSSLKGKVVLLDFTAYQTDFSPSRTLYLRELYDSFFKKGFTIYQVSFDTDAHFWKTSASNLPWVCVRETSGTESTLLQTYNITELPSFFLIDRNGEIVSRDVPVKDLYKQIQRLL